MDKTVGTIAAVTGAVIVYVCLNYGQSINPHRHGRYSPGSGRNSPDTGNYDNSASSSGKKKEGLHEVLFKCRYQNTEQTVMHQGSCHCSRIRFQIKAPAELAAVDIPSKIRFPRLTVPCANFEYLSRQEDCSLYSVASSTGGDQGIHTFCSYCGVHILYAPSIDPIMVHVNVDCLHPENIKSLTVAYHDVMETVPTEFLAIPSENNVRFNRRGNGSIDVSLSAEGIPKVVTPPAVDENGQPIYQQPVAIDPVLGSDPSTPFKSGTPSLFMSGTSAVNGTPAGAASASGANGAYENNDDLWSAVAEGFYETDSSRPVAMSKRYSTFNKDSTDNA
jgi:hypothetical protein